VQGRELAPGGQRESGLAPPWGNPRFTESDNRFVLTCAFRQIAVAVTVAPKGGIMSEPNKSYRPEVSLENGVEVVALREDELGLVFCGALVAVACNDVARNFRAKFGPIDAGVVERFEALKR